MGSSTAVRLLVGVCLSLHAAVMHSCFSDTKSDGCIYYNNTAVVHANCSYRNLTELPDHLEANITSLELVGNRIRHLSRISWEKFISLRNLSIARNDIRILENGNFDNLSKLEVLDLSLNHIRYICIHKGVFKPLKALIYLDLKQDLNGKWKNETYPDALKYLHHLETLMIDGLHSDCLPNMPTLTELYLSGEYGRCNVTSLTYKHFSGVKNIHRLYMSNCSIQKINENTFEELRNLTSLDLARNTQMGGVDAISSITYGLNKHKTIKYLNLNSMYDYINYDLCSSLEKNDLKYLTNTPIEMLLLEKNYIVRIAEGAVQYFPKSLKYLSISDNMFMYGQYVDEMLNKSTLANLIYFDTSKMYKTHVSLPNISPSKTYKSFQTTSLPISLDNNIKTFDSMLTRKSIADDFEIIWDKMKAYGIGKANENSWHKVGNNKKEQPGQSNVEYIDLSESLPGTIEMTLALFSKAPNLKFLNMSNNYLGYPLYDNSTIFGSLRNLRILDISNNRITKLMPDIFKNLTKLEKLYLSDNKLSDVSFDLTFLKNLKLIDLSFNRLETLNKAVRKSLDKLEKVNIANNPLSCTCKYEEFVKWVRSNSMKFENYAETYCISDYNGGDKNFSDSKFFQDLNEKCYQQQYHIIILIVSFCILAFAIILSCGLMYRFKWNLRYIYYMTKFKLLGGYRPIDDREYEKEVFVSYANEDRGFVRQHVVHELETKGNISMLVHDRDFRAGEFVADNIMRAVTSTRRTLVILTTAYIRSKWCMYEINMARMEAADTGRNVLCVILKEDIPMKYLPIEVMDIIKKKTYMEFPTEEVQLELFWERLRATLNHGN